MGRDFSFVPSNPHQLLENWRAMDPCEFWSGSGGHLVANSAMRDPSATPFCRPTVPWADSVVAL